MNQASWFETKNLTNISSAISQTLYLTITDLGNYIIKITTSTTTSATNSVSVEMGFAVGSMFLLTCVLIIITSPLMSHAFRVQIPSYIISRKTRRNSQNQSIDIAKEEDGRRLRSFKHVLHEVSSMFEESQTQVRKALEDFSQPFLGFTRRDDDEDIDDDNSDWSGGKMRGGGSSGHSNDDDLKTIVMEGFLEDQNQMEEGKETTTATTTTTTTTTTTGNNDDDITHFCFLVHGYRGKPADLLYLRSAMAETAEKTFSSSSLKSSSSSKKSKKHRIILHSCQSNWHRTSDGIEAGGERIFDEILTVIQNSMQEHTTTATTTTTATQNDINHENGNIKNVTVSLIGNSLGGLYSRYAIARLAAYAKNQTCNLTEEATTVNNPSNDFNHKNQNKNNNNNNKHKSFLIDGKIRIHFNIFCTTATPHLGVSGHTWFPLPRSAEVGIGELMGQTGRDIFRTSSLIKTMCTDNYYLKPLGSFCKRIAYANGYHTDFVVSTKTAAFLHPESTIPHTMSDRHLKIQQRVENHENNGNKARNNHKDKLDDGMVVATLYTKASKDSSIYSKVTSTDEKLRHKEEPRNLFPKLLRCNSVKEELLEMSAALDLLGWKKVIVDLRNEMPMKLPVPRVPRMVKKNEFKFDDNAKESPSKILESRDVANAYSSPDNFIYFPLAHNTMVAVAQSRLTCVFKGGRPLMDKLAVEMIDEILNFAV